MNTNASGFAQIGQDLHNASFPGYKVPLSVGLDPDVAAAILKAGGDESNNVSGTCFFFSFFFFLKYRESSNLDSLGPPI